MWHDKYQEFVWSEREMKQIISKKVIKKKIRRSVVSPSMKIKLMD